MMTENKNFKKEKLNLIKKFLPSWSELEIS